MTIQQDDLATLTAGRHYLIATDGACKGNPGTGGWGAIIQLKDGEQVTRQAALAGQGPVMISTNNQMELTAAIEALGALAEPLPVVVLSDSEYVVNGMTKWLGQWKATGWRGSSGPVKNRELWERLDQLCSGRQICWVWVRGHNGHGMNEIADQLATGGAAGKYPHGKRSVKQRHPDWFIGP